MTHVLKEDSTGSGDELDFLSFLGLTAALTTSSNDAHVFSDITVVFHSSKDIL